MPMLPYTVLTGVSQGLGEALAAELLARGASVLGIGRRSSPRLAGDRYRFVAADLADATALASRVEPAFRDIAAQRPPRACLVNNAATIEHTGVLGGLGASAIERSLRVNLVAPIVLADLFCRAFRDDAVERLVVNVSSGAAQHAIAGGSLYGIAKAGVEMLTRSLSVEHGSAHFRAVTLRPGIIDTPMQAYARAQPEALLPDVGLFRESHAQGQLVAPDVVARKVVERLLLGDVEDARAYAYAEL